MDYEIKGYIVKWNDGEKNTTQECTTEENALKIAKEKYAKGYTVNIIKESYAVNWI